MREAKRVATVALWALPFVTVLVVVFAVFVVGAPKPYVGVRLLGGPTEGVRRLAFHLAAVERFVEVEQPAVLREVVDVEAVARAGRASWRGHLDQAGSAEVALELPSPVVGGVRITVRSMGRELANAHVELRADAWSRAARRRGGWLRGHPDGVIAVRVAPERGAFAVPFTDPLLIDVRNASGPIAAAALTFLPEGVGIGQTRSETDAGGQARIVVTPTEHAVALRVDARGPGGASGSFYSMLPVVPGALHAALEGERLRLASAVPRERAYFALVTQSARLGGGAARLDSDGRGGAVALVDVKRLLEGSDGADVWAVVSSEADLRTHSSVGWPVRVSERPAMTFDVGNALLLDSMRRGFDEDVGRRQRARLLAGLFTLMSLLLIVSLMRFRVRAAELELTEHLLRAGASVADVQDAQPRRTFLVFAVAALCLALGFTVIALVAMLRIG